MRAPDLIALALRNLGRRPAQVVAVLACLVAILLPWVAGTAISFGVAEESMAAIAAGPDLYLTGEEYGRIRSLPMDLVEEIRSVEGVTEVIPRIAGRAYLEDRLVVILGLPAERLSDAAILAEGAPPGRGEAIAGPSLAEALALRPGDRLTISLHATKEFTVTGILARDAGMGSSSALMIPLEDAQILFGTPGRAGDVGIRIRPGFAAEVARGIGQILGGETYRLQTRDVVRTFVREGFRRKRGIFLALWVLALSVGIPVVLVVSGIGLEARRREIAVLRAMGYRIEEVLACAAVETAVAAAAGWAIAVLGAFLWLRLLNGAFLVRLFVAEAESLPPFPVPFRILPGPAAAGLVAALAVTAAGSLLSTYRAAAASPAEAVR